MIPEDAAKKQNEATTDQSAEPDTTENLKQSAEDLRDGVKDFFHRHKDQTDKMKAETSGLFSRMKKNTQDGIAEMKEKINKKED